MHFKERGKKSIFSLLLRFFLTWFEKWIENDSKHEMHRTLDSYRQLGSWICDYKETLFANGVLNADGTLNHA